MSGPLVDHDPSERELKLLVKDWRTGRATRTLFEAIQDAYVAVLAVAVIGAMVVQLIVTVQSSASTCDTVSCLTARSLLPFAVLGAVVALAVGAARLFGPVLASAAEGFWMLDAPINRASLLRSRLAAAILLAFVAGAGAGALVSALTGSESTLIVMWAVATGLAAAGVVAFAAAEQGADRTLFTKIAVYLFSGVSVAALIMVVGIAANWWTLDIGVDREEAITVVIAGLGLFVLVLAGIFARIRLNRIRRARLTSGGSLAAGMAGAMYALDLGLVRDIVVERNAVERGQVVPRKGKGIGMDALIRRDLARVLRTPSVFLPVLVSLVVPYATVALGAGAFSPLLSALALFGALIPLQGMLRVLTRTAGLARCFPFTGPELRKAAIVVSVGVAVAWGFLTTPAFTSLRESPVEAIPIAMVTAAAGLFGAVRWITAKPIDFGAPMVATQAGAMPTGMFTNAVKGFEVVIIITAPMVFGLTWVISAVLAAIVYWFVMGNFDMDALREQQEQQRKELEKARAEKAKLRGR
ncbi:MAG TPA: ABC transporter permease [Propionibacterium sp.]|jgi:hypothetical protein|nr:ABC transporter permease [Propionibacterium sp.]